MGIDSSLDKGSIIREYYALLHASESALCEERAKRSMEHEARDSVRLP